jgi:UDP-N-acetyl-D-glucosamine dehydrogenase
MQDVPEPAQELHRRIDQGQARVAVIGLGYVGLPLAVSLTERGFATCGFDVDPVKVERLNAGGSYFRHIPDARIAAARQAGFEATADYNRLAEADAILICVPTPLTRYREPDLRFVEATGREIARRLRPGQLVVLESTTYPGTTDEVLRPILESSGLVCGRDVWLAYAPEREDPGNAAFSIDRIPKVVGGWDAVAGGLATALYGRLVREVVPVADARTAEAVKLTENIFRAVNIALVNELKQIYATMGIDVWDVIDAAKTKPFGYMPFYPGPGLGGHCIPIDPFYLTWKARAHDVPTRFVELAGEINTAMPRWVVDRLAEALNQRAGKALNGTRVLLIGLAYKKNVDDTRESPALRLIELLEARGAQVDYYDPHVAEIPPTRDHAPLAGRRCVPWDPAALPGYDAALICTDHDEVDYRELGRRCPLILDTRDAMRRAGADGSNVVKA